MSIYLIKRGPQPAFHSMPYHPVILCDRKRVMQREAGSTNNHAWVWVMLEQGSYGWLLLRWNGLDIDYGHTLVKTTLPDGTQGAIWRDLENYRTDEPKLHDLLPGAVWWSDRLMPTYLFGRAVNYPTDSFTRQSILDTCADDGMRGFGREIPLHWRT